MHTLLGALTGIFIRISTMGVHRIQVSQNRITFEILFVSRMPGGKRGMQKERWTAVSLQSRSHSQGRSWARSVHGEVPAITSNDKKFAF